MGVRPGTGKRYQRLTPREGIRPDSRVRRIRIPQPEKRPIRLTTRDVIRQELLEEDPWWFVTHRRGVRRPWVGLDPLEARAVSEKSVRGYLRERIVYKWLLVAGFREGVDFDFQSSQEGGRMELGGLVVDFLFPNLKIALSVEGPQHENLLRARKDEEQRSILADMGYTYYSLPTYIVDNASEFDIWMRRVFFKYSPTPTRVQVMALYDAPDLSIWAEILDRLNTMTEIVRSIG